MTPKEIATLKPPTCVKAKIHGKWRRAFFIGTSESTKGAYAVNVNGYRFDVFAKDVRSADR